MKTLIAVPCMDTMPTPFVESLTSLELVGECQRSFSECSLVYESRNILAEGAVKYGFDYVLWLDSDMVFQPDFMQRMFESIKDDDFLSGLYFTRKQNVRPTIFSRCRAEVKDGEVLATADTYYDYPEDCRFPIEACGFGAVLMKTSLIKEVYDKFGLPFAPGFGLGEDLSFCLRARQLGKTLYCDSSIKLGHVRHSVSDEAFYKLSRAAERQH